MGGMPYFKYWSNLWRTSWSEVNEVNTGRAGYERSSSGPQTAGIIYGGGVDGSGVTGVVESYNGTSWTEIADVNTARQEGGGFGLQSDAIFAGGFNPGAIVALTESWNGSAWTEVADQATATCYMGSAGGTGSAGFVAGGQRPGNVNATEEWSAPDILVKTFTTS
jgi:hypothetical protein